MNNTPQFKSIRRAAVPLCAFETADPAQTILGCVASLNGNIDEVKLCQWDLLNGLTAVVLSGKAHKGGSAYVRKVSPNGAIDTGNPAECLSKLANTPEQGVIVFWHNAHRFINNEAVAQGLWNLRDIFKANGSTIVMLAPSLTLPSELKQDVVIISEALPDETALSAIVDSICNDAKVSKVEDRDRVIDTLLGLSAFAAEQVLAMSIEKNGDGENAKRVINQDLLWERKKKMIEQTPGLSVWQGGESFEDLRGLSNLKSFLTRILTSGKTPVRAIGFIDEIEKGLAGSAGDTSGTSQDQLQVFLKVMQDLNVPGIILLGPPGTGKSAIAKAAGNVAKCPVVAIDTGAMKGSLVGESEGRIRTAMEVFKAVSQGKGLFIATCNKIASLPPELRRRFTLGTFFVDLPTAEERKELWPFYAKRYEISAKNSKRSFDDTDWTGAEVKACCDVAYRTGLSLDESATFIVPVAKSAPDQVESLRAMAHGRFISASVKGVYEKQTQQMTSTGRRME